MPSIQLGGRSPKQVHRKHRPGQTREFACLDLAMTGGQKPVCRRLERLPSVDWHPELPVRKVHVEPRLPLMLRQEGMSLRYMYPQTGPDKVRLDFFGKLGTMPKAFSREQKAVEVREQPNASLPPKHHQLSHRLGEYPR